MITLNGISIEFDRCRINECVEEFVLVGDKGYICALNANNLTESYIDSEFQVVLNESLINICDGSLVAQGLSLLYEKKLLPYPGPDYFIDFIKKQKYTHCFLGNTAVVLKGLKENLEKLDPKIGLSVFSSLPFCDVSEYDYKNIGKVVNDSGADIIWLSLGSPKQEKFANKLISYINSGIIVCVGAAFDFYGYSDRNNRAPVFLRKIRMEWLWRLFVEPHKTAKRLTREILFMPILFLKEYIKIKRKR